MESEEGKGCKGDSSENNLGGGPTFVKPLAKKADTTASQGQGDDKGSCDPGGQEKGAKMNYSEDKGSAGGQRKSRPKKPKDNSTNPCGGGASAQYPQQQHGQGSQGNQKQKNSAAYQQRQHQARSHSKDPSKLHHPMQGLNLGGNFDSAYSPLGGGVTGSNNFPGASGFSGGMQQNNHHNQPSGGPPSQIVANAQLEALLKCTVCFLVRKPPIYCCQGGHNICSKCRFEAASCPICRQGMSDMRNHTAEALAATYKFPCPFASQGCGTAMNFNIEEQHKSICNYRPVGCEIYPCKDTRVDYRDYIEHQCKNHRAMVAAIIKNKTAWKREVFLRNLDNLLRQGMKTPSIIQFAGHTFIQQTQATGHKMWFWLALFGTPEEAKQFRTTISIKTGNSPTNMMQASWTGPVHSVRHTGDDIYLNGLCMVTTEECLRALITPKNDGYIYSLEIQIDKVL